MTEKRFKLRDTLDKNIQCEEISDNGEWITHGEIVDLLNSLSDENEQLKKELKIYRNVANCSNCEYQNYDWFGDGDEFEICERGNNEQQIEYHICKDWREFE